MDGQNRIELRQQLRKRSPIVKDWDQDHQFAGVCRSRARRPQPRIQSDRFDWSRWRPDDAAAIHRGSAGRCGEFYGEFPFSTTFHVQDSIGPALSSSR